MNYNIILSQNGLTKLALFNLDNITAIDQIREYRNNPNYFDFDIRVEEIADECFHDNKIYYSDCCGREADYFPEVDICPECKEHCGIIGYCIDCNNEI